MRRCRHDIIKNSMKKHIVKKLHVVVDLIQKISVLRYKKVTNNFLFVCLVAFLFFGRALNNFSFERAYLFLLRI